MSSTTTTITPPESFDAPAKPLVATPVPAAPKTVASGSVMHLITNVAGAILILGLGAAVFMIFGKKPEVPTDQSKQDAASIAPIVETADLQSWNQPFHLDIDGEATTYRVLTVGAEVTGRVLEKPETTRSGTFVNKGDVLFEIDPVNYQLDRDRLEARVAQAQEELNAVEVDLKNTTALLALAKEENQLEKNHLERVRSLFDRKATSESEMDTALQRELTSRNTLQTLQNQLNAFAQEKKTKAASLKLAEAELERTLVDLQRCTIASPITGRIVDDMHEVGDYIKPGDGLVHVSDASRMEIKCSLKGDELAWIWQHGQSLNPEPIATSESAAADDDVTGEKKQDPFKMPNVPCEIAFEFEGVETIWDGHLSRYEGTGMDRQTRMFPCRVIVDDPEKTRINSPVGSSGVSPPTLLSGMYVTVRIPINSPVPLLQVPAEAIRPGERIWVARDGKLKIVSVSLVRVDGDSALVRQDGGSLKVGDKVIISPLASVTEDMPVTIPVAKDAPVEPEVKP